MRFLTAGESHGRALSVIIEGLPAGLTIDEDYINYRLSLRQRGYGRGGRMKIETDKAMLVSGVIGQKTIGSPLAFLIANKDYKRWQSVFSGENEAEVTIDGDHTIAKLEANFIMPRPGHADLSGHMKYVFDKLRPVIERASARETAARVLVGSVAELLLKEFGIETFSRVVSIGSVVDSNQYEDWEKTELDRSPVRVLCDPAPFLAEIDKAKNDGDSLGGVVEIKVKGVMPGLGSYVHWDKRLDGQIAQAVASIPAIKGVEIGQGFAQAKLPGSMVHDEIGYDNEFYRYTNRAGGIEGGISTGEDIIVRAAMKPIPTLYKPLDTVELKTHKKVQASVERSDTCAVSAAAIVVEAMVAWVLAVNLVEKFGSDNLLDIKTNVKNYLKRLGEI